VGHPTGSVYYSRTREIMKDSDLYRAAHGVLRWRLNQAVSGPQPNETFQFYSNPLVGGDVVLSNVI